MTSTSIVKCATCNIVINEVLAFLQNKLDVLDNETLIRICVTGFTVEDISNAKKLLFSSIEGSGRMKSRRVDKVQRDLEDMVTLLLNTEPEKTPLFVAKDLHKLPPVDFKHVDVTRLLKDLRLLQSEIRVIRETYVTSEQLCTLKQELQSDSKIDSRINEHGNINGSYNSCINVNKKRGAFLLDSGPIGMTFNNLERSVTEQPVIDRVPQPNTLSHSHAPVQNCVSLPRASSSQQSTTAELAPCEPVSSLDTERGRATDIVLEANLSMANTNEMQYRSLITNQGAKECSYAQVVQQQGEWNEHKDNDKWTLVSKRKRRYKFIGNTGKAPQSPGAKFKAAETKVPLLVSNVDPSTSESDISEYILSKTQDKLSMYKIQMKKDKGYSAYKVFVNKDKLDIYLNKDLWPRGIQFRRFFVFSNNKASDSGHMNNNNNNNK